MVHEEILLQLYNVRKAYRDQKVLKNVNLSVRKGEFVAIVGKSGCGKSTLLRIIAGLETVTGGMVRQDKIPLAGINRHACIMFQNGRLLPWKIVIDNVGIGLKGDWKKEAMGTLKRVGLEDYAGRYPSALSGGQKQRVALARALIHQPDLLLLDEPLGALDALTRMQMQGLIESVWEKNHLSSILVTHDVEEAVRLADRVILLADGKIELDMPIDLPRPRKRSNPLFSRYVEELLAQILNTRQHDCVDAGVMSRSNKTR